MSSSRRCARSAARTACACGSTRDRAFDAELAGWDPTTSLAVLRVPALQGRAARARDDASARVGHLALAVARSWSNAVTASAGIVSVIGGPLPTGRRRAIDQVIRTTAPMHDGFAGGAFLDTSGGLLGVATAAEIRGLGVIIPARDRVEGGRGVLEHGGMKRGYLGIAGQPVTLPEHQRGDADSGDEALLVVGVTPGVRLRAPGVLVGDVILAFDGQPIESPEDLLDLLVGDRVGRAVTLQRAPRRRAARISRSRSVSDHARRAHDARILVGSRADDARACAPARTGRCASSASFRRSPRRRRRDRRGRHPVRRRLPGRRRKAVAEAIRNRTIVPEPLTPREIQVLELLAEGLPNKAIAARLGISDQTVKFHVASISGKLGAANRTDAVRRAVRRGLITL